MRLLKMDSLHTELTNCQFFQSSLLNLMRALREETTEENLEHQELANQLPDALQIPPVV